jgi:hypothetical protein
MLQRHIFVFCVAFALAAICRAGLQEGLAALTPLRRMRSRGAAVGSCRSRPLSFSLLRMTISE